MKRLVCLMALLVPFVGVTACKKAAPQGYKFTMKVLRENTAPAEGFTIETWVKDKSEPKTKQTGADGIAQFDDLAQPDSAHPLVAIVHYYKGSKDYSRKITYPFIESDKERIKATQYIPNMVTPTAQ